MWAKEKRGWSDCASDKRCRKTGERCCCRVIKYRGKSRLEWAAIFSHITASHIHTPHYGDCIFLFSPSTSFSPTSSFHLFAPYSIYLFIRLPAEQHWRLHLRSHWLQRGRSRTQHRHVLTEYWNFHAPSVIPGEALRM